MRREDSEEKRSRKGKEKNPENVINSKERNRPKEDNRRREDGRKLFPKPNLP